MPFVDSPTEQTTAVTDAVLALLALGCIWYLRRIPRRDRLQEWKVNVWTWALAGLALAATVGSVAHGFELPAQTSEFLWNLIFLSLGLTVALFVVAVVYDGWGRQAARRVLPMMLLVGLAFFGLTLRFPGTFQVFIFFEAVAMLFALAAYAWLAFRKRFKGAGWMAAGILVTIIAAVIQAGQSISITFIWPFDHNGLYHLVQMVGLVALVIGLQADLLPQTAP
jgi:hypothetical protein